VDYEEAIYLYWPDENSTEEVLTALRINDADICISLTCDFDDERMGTSQELQDAIMNCEDSAYPYNLRSLSIYNNCDNREKSERCLDFFLQSITINPTYMDSKPWTLVEAQKVATGIASFSSYFTAADLTLSGDVFAIEGTFECVFNAVIDGGIIDEFVVQAESIPDLKLGCIGRSNLATNTTLKKLELCLWYEDDVVVVDEGIEQLANALKSNRYLEEIIITRSFITNTGHRFLLESLRDNITLLNLDKKALAMGMHQDDDVNEDETLHREGGIEGRLLQSQFDRHMKLNRFWKRLKKRGNDDEDNDDEDEDDSDNDNDENGEKELGRRSISMEILPDVLEILAKKPLLLYKFLREEDHTQQLGTLYDRPSHRIRRRSERLFKKRRITAPGSEF